MAKEIVDKKLVDNIVATGAVVGGATLIAPLAGVTLLAVAGPVAPIVAGVAGAGAVIIGGKHLLKKK